MYGLLLALEIYHFQWTEFIKRILYFKETLFLLVI